ncbi:MAG: hypothetical protein ACOYKE_02600, partial [Ferruginibacter sp.]
RFRVNGAIAGFLDSSGITRNTSFGLESMNNETIRGVGNTAVGYRAMSSVLVADSNNTFIGVGVGFTGNSGLHRSYNVGIGSSTLLGINANSNALFSRNIAIGHHALRNTGSTGNIAIGVSAGRGLAGTQVGNQDSMNIAIGDSAMATPYQGLATGWSNSNSIAIGKNALLDRSGNRNIAIGNYAASLVDFGVFDNPTDNVSIGHSATPKIKTGSFNVFIGSVSGQTLSTGQYNVGIGYGVECATGTGTGQLSIQNIIYGNGNTGTGSTVSTGSIGIGTRAPSLSAILDIASTTKGVTLPRMTQAERLAIGSPIPSMLVYQLDGTEGYYVYKSTGWVFAF